MAALLLALDPPRIGFVLERDFRLVLALAGGPSASATSRQPQRALDALVRHYRVAPSRDQGAWRQSGGRRATPVAPEATAAADAAAATDAADAESDAAAGVSRPPTTSNPAWPVNYERCALREGRTGCGDCKFFFKKRFLYGSHDLPHCNRLNSYNLVYAAGLSWTFGSRGSKGWRTAWCPPSR